MPAENLLSIPVLTDDQKKRIEYIINYTLWHKPDAVEGILNIEFLLALLTKAVFLMIDKEILVTPYCELSLIELKKMNVSDDVIKKIMYERLVLN